MDERAEEFGAIMQELMALEGADKNPKSTRQLRTLGRRIEALGGLDDAPDMRPLRRAWSEKFVAAFPMPSWAPNKWLPLDHENVMALAKRHKMCGDGEALAGLRQSLVAALTRWGQQFRADTQPTSQETEQQITDVVAAADALGLAIEKLPEQIKIDLDEDLRDCLPETAIWNFLQILKDRLPKAAEAYLEGKRWTERLGYVPQTGRGTKGKGEAFRELIKSLVDVWEEHAPNQKKNRAWASKRNDGRLDFNDGGRFIRDAAALLTRGEAPELTPVVLRDVVKPDPHQKIKKLMKLVRSTTRPNKDS